MPMLEQKENLVYRPTTRKRSVAKAAAEGVFPGFLGGGSCSSGHVTKSTFHSGHGAKVSHATVFASPASMLLVLHDRSCEIVLHMQNFLTPVRHSRVLEGDHLLVPSSMNTSTILSSLIVVVVCYSYDGLASPQARKPTLLANWEDGLASFLCSIEGTGQAVRVGNALDTVGGVDVLDESDLVAGGATLTRDDGAVCEEVFPDLDIHQQYSLLMFENRLTRYHLMPYLATILSLFPIQFLYHLQRVAE